MDPEGYVLRSRDREELARLELQHRAWKKETDAVVDLAGFGPGDRLMDLGCGPGCLALELAERVGRQGSVLGVDSSELFVRHLNREAGKRRQTWLRAVVADGREIELEDASLDGAICRWVLMFVSEPERAIERVARALRPGGVFAVMEYVQFRSSSLWPEGRSFRTIYDAVQRLIAGAGGDADIGGRIPALLRRAGLEIVELLPFWRVGRPGSDLWNWLEQTHGNHQGLVEAGLIGSGELDTYLREWQESSRDPAAFFTAPPVLATIARSV